MRRVILFASLAGKTVFAIARFGEPSNIYDTRRCMGDGPGNGGALIRYERSLAARFYPLFR